MSDNTSGSTVVAESSNNGLSAESRILRRAKARQHSDNIEANIPDETSVDADVSGLFDESGMLVSADEVGQVGSNNTVSVDDDAEAYLEAVAPGKLSQIKSTFESLPGTLDELVKYHARKVAKEHGDSVRTTDGDVRFTITTHRKERSEDVSEVLRKLDEESTDDETDGTRIAVCPECGAEDVTGHTVEMQTRAADESGTQITKTSCGCTFRRTD